MPTCRAWGAARDMFIRPGTKKVLICADCASRMGETNGSLGDYMGRKNKRSNTDLSRLAQKLHVPRAEVVKSQKEKSKLGVEPKGGEPLNSQAANIPM
jgi:topoisomerase IA-like protein